MNTLSDQDWEQLSAYLDGELDDAARAQMALRLQADPALNEVLSRMQRVDAAIVDAVNAVHAQAQPRSPAVPPALKLVRGGASVAAPRATRLPRRGLALAASVLLASAAVLLNTPPDNSAPIGNATASLNTVLDSALSGGDWHSLPGGSAIKPILSFPTHDGRWCREYALKDQSGSWRGIACRAQQGWENAVVVADTGSNSGDVYRPAGAAELDVLSEFAAEQAADIPAGRQQERELIQTRWQQ